MNELSTNPGFFVINTLADAFKIADLISKSSFCPKNLKGFPGDILICMQMGKEVGLQPLNSLQNIAVINGKPSIYGDAMPAICMQSPDWEYMEETYDEATMAAICKIKRRNESEHIVKFSKDDAIKAKLWGKEGPWSQYPKRMLQMRARSFALRDKFADRLRGMIAAEEAQDYPLAKTDYSNITVPPKEPMDGAYGGTAVNLITPEELTLLNEKIIHAKANIGNICERLNISTLSEMPKSMLPKVLEKLDKQIAALVAKECAESGENEPFVDMSHMVEEPSDTVVADFFGDELGEKV